MANRIRFLLKRLGAVFRKNPERPLTLEQKLEVLARGGLRLEPPFTIKDLLRSFPREEYEKPGFDLLLSELGMTEEGPPWRNYRVNVWTFDTECIEGPGSYCRIAEQMKLMAEGSLPIENIRDHVDEEAGYAWLAFTYKGEEIRINCKVDSDWVDPKLFPHFVRLLSRSDPSKTFIYYGSGGQDCILACVTNAVLRELKRAGINFQPLGST